MHSSLKTGHALIPGFPGPRHVEIWIFIIFIIIFFTLGTNDPEGF